MDRLVGLAAHLPGLAQGQHDLVGRLGRRDRVREAVGGGAVVRGVVRRRLVVAQGAALDERRTRRLGLDAREHAHGVIVLALSPPGAEHVVLVVAERADDHGLLARVEGQRGVVVLQQHHRLAGCGAGCRAVGRGEEAGRVGGLRLVDVRVVEEAGAELDPQDPAYRVVEPAHGDPMLRQQLGAEVTDVGAHHLRVGARPSARWPPPRGRPPRCRGRTDPRRG